MKISNIKTEIESIFEFLKTNEVEEVPGVLYMAQACTKNIEIYAIEIKFNAELFINSLWLTAHEAIRYNNKSYKIPKTIINNAPKPGWNINVTISKIKEEVNDCKIAHLISENKILKTELNNFQNSIFYKISKLITY